MPIPTGSLSIGLQQLDPDPGDRGYAVEASAIGLGPGEWPASVHVTKQLSTVRSFYYIEDLFDSAGEFAGMRYRSGMGKELVIFND